MTADLKTIVLSNDVTVATFRDALLVHFRGLTPPGSIAPMRAALAAITATYPKAAFFGVIELSSTPPDAETRAALTTFLEDGSARLGAFVVAYRGEGFRGAMVRTVIAAVVSVMPRFRLPFPREVVQDIAQAAAVAAKHIPRLDASALHAAFDDLARMTPI